MLLKGKNGNELELSFVRDALPEQQDGFGDDAWCTVTVRAATADESWEESSPCMNFYEFQNLAEWLEAVGTAGDATGAPEASEIELLEPELKFSVSQSGAEGVGIRVGFHLEDRPEEFEVDTDTDEAEYVDLFMERSAIRSAAASLREVLAGIESASGNGKDDLRGDETPGVMGLSEDDMNLVDGVSAEPPFAGDGEDNAGNR